MKIVITVTDENSAHATTVEALSVREESVSTNGHASIQEVDGGPVPAILLDMESEVAAGLRRAPGQSF